MYNYEQTYDDVMPELNLLEKKQSPNYMKQSANGNEEVYRSKAQEIKKSGSDIQSPSKRKNSYVPTNMNNMEHPSMAYRYDESINKKHTNSKISNELSKNLISQMLKKISLRSMAEENYPISNETVEKLMMELEEQIQVVNTEIGKLENSLLLNPSNQHLKKELQTLYKNLNQIQTIKDLYKEKIEHRNKISQLQSKIMDLKTQNRELKIKIERGIQKIQSHIHNLPCQKQKELIEELNKYKEALNRETEMRQKLEQNINSINLNFKRFYEQADIARKIVSDQLKMISKKQQELNSKLQKSNLDKTGQEEVFEGKSAKLTTIGKAESFKRQPTNRISEEENIADIINQINQQQHSNLKQSFPDQLTRTHAFNAQQNGARIRSYTNQFNPTAKNVQGNHGGKHTEYNYFENPKAFHDGVGQTSKKGGSNYHRQNFDLQEQIQKMRMNQAVFNKTAKKKM